MNNPSSIFVEYPKGQKAYKVYTLENHKPFTTRDVWLYEEIFPFHGEQDANEDILLPMTLL